MPSSAVTSTESALAPTSRAITVLALPDDTAARLEPAPAFWVAFGWAAVAVRRASLILWGTVAEYSVVPSENVPMSSADQLPSAAVSAVRSERFAFDESSRAFRVTVTV